MIKKSPTRPDITSQACAAAMQKLAKSLASHHGGSASVILTNQDGVAIQACALDAVNIANMAYAAVLYACESLQRKVSVCDCSGCRSVLARFTAARDILADSPAAASGHRPTHRVH